MKVDQPRPSRDRHQSRRRLALWSGIVAFVLFTAVVIVIEDVTPTMPWDDGVTTVEPTPEPTPDPTEEPTPDPTPTREPRPTATPPAQSAAISDITPIDVPDPIDEVGGIYPIELDDEDAREEISVPGATWFPELQTAALRYVDAQREILTEDAGDSSNTNLEVSYTPFVAHGQILGFTQHSTRTFPRAVFGVTHTQSLYLDVLRGDTYRGTDLLTEDAKADLEESIYASLYDAEILSGVLGQDDGDLFADVRLSDDGEMVIVIGEGMMATRSSGLIAVQIPASEVSPLLSEAGQVVYDGVVTDSDFLGLRTDEPLDCSELRCVALTFDDGPNRYTPIVLDALEEKEAHATFFLLGVQAERNPELVQRIWDEGHDIGGHTWDHEDLTKLEPDELAEQLEKTGAAIRAVTGYDHLWERPPYGSYDDDVLEAYEAMGYTAVMWHVDPRDWRDRDPEVVLERVLDEADDNSIVLLHDIHESTGEAVADIVDELRAEGFTLVRLSDVVQHQPGHVVSKLND